ncbi:hypothetical protein KAU37_06100 [Candidatus Bipolaricaulota bacterium]|nr:hypothetical protein [Candidatus Bipolaricaulota bacterium]
MSDHCALVVIDMQRGFLEKGYPPFCGEEARRDRPGSYLPVSETKGTGRRLRGRKRHLQRFPDRLHR